MSIHAQDETTRSAPHRRVERILDGMSIMYESESPFPPYSVDIYLGEFHAGLEIDGPQHSAKKDGIRDANLLEKYFLPVMHMPIDLSVEDVKKSVTNFIELIAESTEVRKWQWRQGGA